MIIELFKIKKRITGYITEENGKYFYYFGRPSDKEVLLVPFSCLEDARKYAEERKVERKELIDFFNKN